MRRREFHKRAASVEPECEPGRADSCARLTRDELADVIREADRPTAKTDCWSRAAITRQLAEDVAQGADLMMATLRVVERAKTALGTAIPLGELDDVW